MPKRLDNKRLKDLIPQLQESMQKTDSLVNSVGDLVKLLSTKGTKERPKGFSEERYLKELQRERTRKAQQDLVELRFKKNLFSLEEDLQKKEKSKIQKELEVISKRRETVERDLELLREQKAEDKTKDPLKYAKLSKKYMGEGDVIGSLLFKFVSKTKGEQKKAEEFLKAQRVKEKEARKAAAEEE